MDATPSWTGQGERQEPAGQCLCCEGARWAGAPGAMQMGVRQRPRRPEGPRRGLPAGAEDTEAALLLPCSCPLPRPEQRRCRWGLPARPAPGLSSGNLGWAGGGRLRLPMKVLLAVLTGEHSPPGAERFSPPGARSGVRLPSSGARPGGGSTRRGGQRNRTAPGRAHRGRAAPGGGSASVSPGCSQRATGPGGRRGLEPGARSPAVPVGAAWGPVQPGTAPYGPV